MEFLLFQFHFTINHQRFHNEDDFAWGVKILDWNMSNLMEINTGFVWDGINRLGDGKIDFEWKFTYNQGIMIGALVERYRITEEKKYLDDANRIVKATIKQIARPNTMILPYEGKDDCGLFKGIFIRYLYELLTVSGEDICFEIIQKNAEKLVKNGINCNGLIGGDWIEETEGIIDLAQHLSGIMLLEMAVKTNHNHTILKQRG